MGGTASENITSAAIGRMTPSIPYIEMWASFKVLGSADQEEVAMYSTSSLGRGVNLAPRQRGGLQT
jgi:hypothetical protein